MVRRSNYFALFLSAAILAGLAAASPGLLRVVSLLLSLLFLGGIYVRLCATAASLLRLKPKPRPLSDRDLPTFTILAPMYREASVAAQFIAALKRLDYPVFGSKLTNRKISGFQIYGYTPTPS
jgi:cellulose synthase/poly-beta-1,6-N-acetylglucosamine synthase-like glycosyltransferase